MGKLFIVATPLGNLGDITHRATETLKEVDFVVTEDTRVSGKLLSHLSIQKPLLSYNQHSGPAKYMQILNLLREGKSIALLTDAGTPGVSDPGNELVSFLLAQIPELEVIPIPGASAVTAIISVSGFNAQHFTFLGFFPKKKHTRFLKELLEYTHPVIFFDSPFRIKKTILDLSKTLLPQTKIVVARELTKMHETIYRGTSERVLALMEKEPHLKGEFVVIVELPQNSPS